MCFRTVSSNVNNGGARQAVISGPHPLAFTTGGGSRDVREAVSFEMGVITPSQVDYIRARMSEVLCVVGWKLH